MGALFWVLRESNALPVGADRNCCRSVGFFRTGNPTRQVFGSGMEVKSTLHHVEGLACTFRVAPRALSVDSVLSWQGNVPLEGYSIAVCRQGFLNADGAPSSFAEGIFSIPLLALWRRPGSGTGKPLPCCSWMRGGFRGLHTENGLRQRRRPFLYARGILILTSIRRCRPW